jgi:hypothetical protein
MKLHNSTRAEAAKMVDRLDAGRAEFCRRHFHHDVKDPQEYDLTVNTARLAPEAAAELIVDAFCRAQREGIVPEWEPGKTS